MEMEHATFVPVSPDRMTRALRASRTVAAGIPGWQPDDPERPLPAGRLRLRVAGSTITYRGTLAVEAPPPPASPASPLPAAVLEAHGEEVRGSGTASARLAVTLEPAARPEPGTTVTFTGTAQADGRLMSYEGAVVDAALRRLLDRFCAQLAENAPEEPADTGEPPNAVGAAGAAAPATGASPTAPDADERVPRAGEADGGDDARDEQSVLASAGPEATGGAPHDTADPGDETVGDATTGDVADADAADAGGDDAPGGDVRAGDADEGSGDTIDDGVDDGDDGDDSDDGGEVDDIELVEVEVEVPESAAALDDLVSPAEAAHARRTMIGRSAEEVDHAPPRGRYAPEPAPDAVSAAATLRWAAPAAAALLASAVVVGRVLRRRR